MVDVIERFKDREFRIGFYIISLFILIALIAFFFVFLRESSSSIKPQTTILPTPIPVVSVTPIGTSLESDYSQLNKIVPGKSTSEDVKVINGEPYKVDKQAKGTYMWYPTPLAGYSNVVFLKNNLVYYSVENVFGDYRGSFETIKTTNGTPDMTLFEQGNGFAWSIYLSKGLGYMNDGKDIGAILYFSPTSKESFNLNIASDLNLSSSPSAIE